MKFVPLLLSAFLSTSCTPTVTTNIIKGENENEEKTTQAKLEKVDSKVITKAITLAKKNKDYRLMVTSGRNMSIPGINSSDYKEVVELCGKKYSSGVGDVITSEKQRLTRRKEVDFMREYNEQMLVICQSNSSL